MALACLEPRVARLEASAEANPPASIGLVGQLEDKVESLAASQVRQPGGGQFLRPTPSLACRSPMFLVTTCPLHPLSA